MEVLKQTSPQAEAGAPKPWPWNTEPSSRARIAFIQHECQIMLGQELCKSRRKRPAGEPEIRNPRFEIRSKSEVTMTKSKNQVLRTSSQLAKNLSCSRKKR